MISLDLFRFTDPHDNFPMVRSLLQRVLGGAGNQAGAAQPALELPPSDSRERARAMVIGLQDDLCRP